MKTINLRNYYYPCYKEDVLVEVSDEVAEALLLMLREENNRRRKIYYHKAYFSLDREDGIENAALCGFEKSPEDIFMEQEEERFFLLTLERGAFPSYTGTGAANPRPLSGGEENKGHRGRRGREYPCDL